MALTERKAVEELYGGELEDFTARRNEAAKRLRGQGEGDAADRVKALKKPSRGAWAINMVSSADAGLRKELLDAGAGLRGAQERLVAGEGAAVDLRKAGEREQEAVAKVAHAAAALSADAGSQLSPALLERVRKTLHAVALDDDVRRDFEAGRLTAEHEAAGLGGMSLAAAPPGRKREREGAKRRRDALKRAERKAAELEARREQAERDAERARQEAEEANRALERATRALERTSKEAAAARVRADELAADSS